MSAGKYIVTFKTGTDKAAVARHADAITAAGGQVTAKWFESERPVLNGFAAIIPATHLQTIRAAPELLAVEEDGPVHAST